MATLKNGDVGSEVVTMQGWLITLSYLQVSSALYDDTTTAAVRQFQGDYSLDPTGNCDEDTWQWLDYYASHRSPVATNPRRQGGGSQSPAAGTWAVIDESGGVLGEVQPRVVTWAGPGDPSELEQAVSLAVRQTLPGRVAVALAAETGGTVAFGIDLDLGTGIGVSYGIGLFVTADGRVGGYESVGGDVGLILGGSAELVVIVIDGGPEHFGGVSWAVEASAGIPVFGALSIGGGGAVMFDTQNQFLGVCIGIGISARFPVSAYWSTSKTTLYQF